MVNTGVNDITDKVIKGLSTTNSHCRQEGFTKRQCGKEQQRERVGKKKQVRIRRARRSNTWGKQKPAVKHADAKHWVADAKKVIEGGMKEEKKQENEKEWKKAVRCHLKMMMRQRLTHVCS